MWVKSALLGHHLPFAGLNQHFTPCGCKHALHKQGSLTCAGGEHAGGAPASSLPVQNTTSPPVFIPCQQVESALVGHHLCAEAAVVPLEHPIKGTVRALDLQANALLKLIDQLRGP